MDERARRAGADKGLSSKRPYRAAGGLANAAAAGMIATVAERLVEKEVVKDNCELPSEFWKAVARHPLDYIWDLGSFDIWFEGEHEWQAFGVQFDRAALEQMAPRSTAVESLAASARGRRRSNLWVDWVAELTHHLHHVGIPQGVETQGIEELLTAIDARLQERGKRGPERSTVQDTARAVLLRLRSADN